jgi:hypothetical protein
MKTINDVIKEKIAAVVEKQFGGDWDAARAAFAAKVAEIRAREEQTRTKTVKPDS